MLRIPRVLPRALRPLAPYRSMSTTSRSLHSTQPAQQSEPAVASSVEENFERHGADGGAATLPDAALMAALLEGSLAPHRLEAECGLSLIHISEPTRPY